MVAAALVVAPLTAVHEESEIIDYKYHTLIFALLENQVPPEVYYNVDN